MKRYEAFISCSFSESERATIAWFVHKIEAFSIKCYIANEKVTRPAVDKIRDGILERDCLIAIVPEAASAWIDSEIGMAIALGKPVIAFYANGRRPSGPYPLIADYAFYRPDALDQSISDVISLINSLLRSLDAMAVTDPDHSESAARMFATTEEVESRLADLLTSATNTLDIWAYSTETFLLNGFLSSLIRDSDVQVRVLVRHPDIDSKKGPIIAGQIAAVRSAFGDKVDRLEIRCYEEEPLFRCAVFDSTTGLYGMYRWVPDTYFEFIGSESNALIELRRDTSLGKLWMGLIESRFEQVWNKRSKATPGTI